MDEIEKKIIKIICDISGDNSAELHSETKLQDTSLSSFLIIQLIIEIEEKFQLELEDEDLDFSKYSKVGDVCEMVAKYV